MTATSIHRIVIGSEVNMFAGPIGKQMMIEQGYVPATCTMNDQIAGLLIYAEVSKGRSPCDGCNGDRSVCHGKPKDPEYDVNLVD